MTNFSVIQYVPDPIADERINIGVVAWDQNDIKISFIADTKRAKQLGGERYLSIIEQARDNLMEIINGADPEQSRHKLLGIIEESHNVIQFKSISITRAAPAVAINELAAIFLKERQRQHRIRRGRSSAVKLFADKAENIALRVWQDEDVVEHVLKLKKPIEGSLTHHNTAFAVQNGLLRVIGLADSMEADSTEDRRGKLLFDAQDIRQAHNNIPVALLLLPPREADETSERIYRETVQILNRLQVTALQEDQVEQWLDDTFTRIPLNQLRSA